MRLVQENEELILQYGTQKIIPIIELKNVIKKIKAKSKETVFS